MNTRLVRDDQRGAISALVVTMVVALMVMAGLVVDGGNAINARAKITDDAEQAARAGANQIDVDLLRSTGKVRIDEAAAKQAAQTYLTTPPLSYTNISVDPDVDEVSVVIEDTAKTQLLSLIHINDFPIRGEATARATVGITQEIP